MADKLNAYDDLAVIGSITSQNGQSSLVLQGDGNLVLYRLGGPARWATGTVGKVVAQAVMQGDGNFVMYGPGAVYIWDTATDGHPGAYLVVQDDGNLVIYDTSGNPLWASNTNIIRAMVLDFLPGTSGFHFINSFPSVPLFTINVLGQQIPIGNASNGLCGGMVYAVRDFFEAKIPVWPDTTSPSSGPLFDYIVKRLFDSFDLILPPPPLPPLPPPFPPFTPPFTTPMPPFGPGPVTYMWLMDTGLPDHETVASNIWFAPRGRAWIMINDQWPKIKVDIDSNRLSPIGLIEIKSLDPTQMGLNHQVLAYGYDLDGNDLKIHIYDPNHPDNDSVSMAFNIANPQVTTSVNYSTGETILCFFRTEYTFSSPPPFVVPVSVGVGDHFYTTSASERDNAVANFGYHNEGIACYLFSATAKGRTPFYRLLNSSNGDHFYTTSASERDNAVANFGYHNEGIACYVYRWKAKGRIPFYRLLNSSNGDHFYTTSASERDNAVANFGYLNEGIACYVFSGKAKVRIPFYRLLKIA